MPRPTVGKIPPAGSLAAAQFARRRANEIVSSRGRRSIPLAHAELFNLRRPRRGAAPSSIPLRSTRFYGGVHHPVTKLREEFPAFGLLPSITTSAQVRLGTRFDRFGKKTQLVDIKGFQSALNRIVAMAGLPHIGARYLVWHLGRWCLMEMVSLTPIDQGAAVAGWSISPQLRGKGKGYGKVGFRIQNSVPYIIYLEYGHSRQAPRGMQRITFANARRELHNLMDTLIFWWKAERYTLRNLKFDKELAAGTMYDPAKVEKRIPNMTWQRLVNDLKSRLPLDKPVAHLNANLYLAMRIDDPVKWHTVSDFEEPGHVFDVHTRSRETPVFETADVPVDYGEFEEMTRQVGTRMTTTIEHVRHESEVPLSRPDLSRQANELERLWGGRR